MRRPPMKAWAYLAAVTACLTSCTPVNLRPTMGGRTGADIQYTGLYTVFFEVACDSCRIEYGPEGSTRRDVANGGWTGSVPLGSMRDGERVRVILSAQPVGDAHVLLARVGFDGRTVASREADEPGQTVYIRTRVGPG